MDVVNEGFVFRTFFADGINVKVFSVSQTQNILVECLVVFKVLFKLCAFDQTSLFVLVYLVKYQVLACAQVSGVWTVYNLNLVYILTV